MFCEFAFRYLKQQKKHTVLTITAIIIAVAFMTIMLSAVSIYRATSANITRSTTGSYHVLFSTLDRDQTVVIGGMDIFEEIEIYSLSYYTSSTEGAFDGEDKTKQYLACNGYIVEDWFLRLKPDDTALLPDYMTGLVEGRLPEKDGELVINAAYTENWGNPSLGDTVTLHTLDCSPLTGSTDNSAYEEIVPTYLRESVNIDSSKEITFTVVGFSDGYNIVHYNDTRFSSGTESYNNIIARFTDECTDLYWDMHFAFQDVGYEIDDFDYSLNQELINEEGKGYAAKEYQIKFFAVCYLFVIFLMFCVRMVIDNSFEISSKERIRQFGLLKAVGASASQIFRIILWEALLLAVVGVPLGLLLGWGASRIMFSALSGMESLNTISSVYDFTQMLVFRVEWYVYVLSFVIGVVWVAVSAIGTGMRVIRATPVDAMRMASRREKIRTGRFRSKLGNGKSFVPVYASLSIKRNKKRYIVTMLSMVLSIVIFTGFSYALDLAEDNIEKTFKYDRLPYDFSISSVSIDTSGVQYDIDKLEESGLFEDIQYDTNVRLYMSSEDIGAKIPSNNYEKTGFFLKIHPVNRTTFEEHVQTDMTYDELLESGGVLICSNAVHRKTDTETFTYIESMDGGEFTADEFILSEMAYYGKATVTAVGLFETDSSLYLTLPPDVGGVIAEENYDALVAQTGRDGESVTYEFSDGSEHIVFVRTIGANVKNDRVEEARAFLMKHFYGSYEDNLLGRQNSESLLSLIAAAGYFLIVVFSLIAAVNVANIISTNVLNRSSELGVLRACGMSDKQLYSLVRTESMMYALLAAICSVIVTVVIILGIQIPFKYKLGYLSESDLIVDLSCTAPLVYTAIAAVAAFVVAVASSYFPARRIIKSSVVEAVREIE